MFKLEKSQDLLSKSESVKFLLIESVICLFTDSPVKKYISLLNQLIITKWISGKNIFTVKSVNFHWNNQWNLTDLQWTLFSYLNQSNFTDNQ